MKKTMNADYEERYEKAQLEFEMACENHSKSIGIIGRCVEKLFGDSDWSYNKWYKIKKKYNL